MKFPNTFKGAFNNYVDQILTNLTPSPLEWTSVDILADPPPPLLDHVVVECPLIISGTSDYFVS